MSKKTLSNAERYRAGCEAVHADILKAIFHDGLETALKTARTMSKGASPGDPVYDVCLEFLIRHKRVN